MLNAKNPTSIPVYQALNQPEKITNQTDRPDLVYSKLTTFNLLLRQVKKDGIGIIFSQHRSTIDAAKKALNIKQVITANYHDLQESIQLLPPGTRVLVISLNPGTTVRVSDIEFIAKTLVPSAHSLKWISILQQPNNNQLFKWELKYNGN